jgi:cytochrome c oxidase subunit II
VNIPSNIVTLIFGIILTLASLWYGQNHGLMPVAASESAKDVDSLFNLMMTIATGLFLLVEGVLVYILIKFRRKKGDQTDGPPIEGNVGLEIVWTAIPTIIVFILAVYSFDIYNRMGGLDPMASHDMGTKIAHNHNMNMDHNSLGDNLVALDTQNQRVALGLGVPSTEDRDNTLVVNVNGIQYAWIFTYPETGIVSGEVHVPVNRPVQLNMVAGDVIHAFWLPEFRIKQDVVPGRETQLSFVPNLIGSYPIICAELCGSYHGGMKTTLYVESQEDYDKWVQNNTFASNDLDKAVASNVKELSDQEYLAPYGQEIGVNTETIAHLHH